MPNGTQRSRHGPPSRDIPVVIYHEAARRGLVVLTCSRSALIKGVTPGLPLAEAKALVGNSIYCEQYDAQACRESFLSLAEWAHRFSPIVGIEQSDSPDSMFLDVTGCIPLFESEWQLAEQVVQAFRDRGLKPRVVIARTIGAAWAIAHYRQSPQVVPAGKHSKTLRELPVQSLRLPHATLNTLRELEIRSVGQLEKLPRSSLPSRLGPDVLLRIDQAFGRIPELIVPYRPSPEIETEWLFEYPVCDRLAIDVVFQRLIEQIVDELQERLIGVRRLLCSIEGTDHPAVSFSVELVQPSSSRNHLMELIRLQLDSVTLNSEVTRIYVQVTATDRQQSKQPELFDNPRDQNVSKELALLVDRLSNQIGRKQVLRIRQCPDAQPESAVQYEPMIDHCKPGRKRRPEVATATLSKRPVLLKPQPIKLPVKSIIPGGPPVRFRWKTRDYTVRHSWGPERIETGWWRARHIRRDYYRVETESGERFWLFHCLCERAWFFHGLF